MMLEYSLARTVSTSVVQVGGSGLFRLLLLYDVMKKTKQQTSIGSSYKTGGLRGKTLKILIP